MSLYKEKRGEVGSGDVLAWTHRGWGSWYDFQIQVVRMFTRSEYAHVGVAWVIGGRVFVFEAVSSGVRIMPLSRLLPCYWLRIGRWNEAAEEFALQQVAQPYSRVQAIMAGLGLLKVGHDTVWQCAELVIEILGYAGVHLHGPATPSSVVDNLLELDCSIEILK